MIAKTEIVGIYLNERKIEACRLRKRLNRWTHAAHPWQEPKEGTPLSQQLQQILGSLRPSHLRMICLGLPRSAYFLREIPFPRLEPEEAASAVKLGIGLHAHLEPDKIYHDQWAFRRNGETQVLSAYVPRSYLDPLMETLKRTRHIKSLGTVAPATLGLDILLRKSPKAGLPAASLALQDSDWVLSLHGSGGWEGSHKIPVKEESSLKQALEQMASCLPAPFDGLAREPAYCVGDRSKTEAHGLKTADPCKALADLAPLCAPDRAVTWGLCAAALGIDPYPALSLQAKPRRQPLRNRVRPAQLAVAAAAVLLALATWQLNRKVEESAARITEQRKEIARLSKELQPLVTTQEKIELLEKTLADLDAFRKERLPVLPVLKELTESTSSETWIKSFNMNEQRIRVNAEGGSAVDTMNEWMTHPLFRDVKLVSSVTKARNKGDRFSAEIRIDMSQIDENQ